MTDRMGNLEDYLPAGKNIQVNYYPEIFAIYQQTINYNW